ncbi:MAG: tetratricopeptide repeat protein [Planctomycetes bacterium]|nr:tetratricopeptide repeat protein [Planctomycetota bacterium]
MSTKPGGNVSKISGIALAVAALVVSACASGKTIKQGTEEFSILEGKYYEALSLQDNGQYFEAIEAWSEVLDDEPRFAQGHFNLGLIYDNLNMVPEAIEKYEIAVRITEDIKPDIGIYSLHLGAAYLRSGLVDEGIDALTKALEIDPYNPAIHYNLSAAYLAKSNYDDALRHADTAVDLYAQPDSKRTDGLAQDVDRARLGNYLLRQARCHVEREEWDKAKSTLERAKKQCNVDSPRDMMTKIEAAEEAAAAATEESSDEG